MEAHGSPLCLQVIEFESSPLLMVGHALGLRVSLIAYPVISIKKAGHCAILRLLSLPQQHCCILVWHCKLTLQV